MQLKQPTEKIHKRHARMQHDNIIRCSNRKNCTFDDVVIHGVESRGLVVMRATQIPEHTQKASSKLHQIQGFIYLQLRQFDQNFTRRVIDFEKVQNSRAVICDRGISDVVD
jgi:hypothetical protein